MKKMYMLLIIAFTLFVAPMAHVAAADVPGFYQVGGNYLTFTGREDTSKGYRVYGYDCDVDLRENFAERYLNALVNNFNFSIVDHYVNDYRRGQAKMWDVWVLRYDGNKNPSTFVHKNPANLRNPYYCHLVVSRGKDWNTEITHFSVRISYDLSYGED
ncbi:MAG: hypothetical protein J6H31_06105 [Butyrivibrio sp.]|nr:hypothetical protein [Butyrivibrio sp.]